MFIKKPYSLKWFKFEVLHPEAPLTYFNNGGGRVAYPQKITHNCIRWENTICITKSYMSLKEVMHIDKTNNTVESK